MLDLRKIGMVHFTVIKVELFLVISRTHDYLSSKKAFEEDDRNGEESDSQGDKSAGADRMH